MPDKRSPEDHKHCPWTEEQLERFADPVADKAIDRIQSQTYQTVGKVFINKLYYVVGAVILGLFYYLQMKGIIK